MQSIISLCEFREPEGGGSTVGTECGVDNELAKVRGFSEGDRRGFSKKFLG